MRYYDLKKNWTRKIVPHLSDPEVIKVLVADMDKFTFGRWGSHFTVDMLPAQVDSCDWRCDRRGRMPRFWDYASHSKCHWLVNFNLELAKRAVPRRPWRIRTSQKHSTVWDGEELLFDINFSALDVPPDECFTMSKGRILKIGKRMETYPVPHWKTETKNGK